MNPDQAAWIREHVIDAYLDGGANHVHRWCRPSPWPDEPAATCSHKEPVCMLRAPRPYGPPDPRGEDRPQLYHSVWLADATGAPRRAEQMEDWAAWVRE